MEYYYTPKENVNVDKNELIIDGFEFRHLTKVLRKAEGDSIAVTDGSLNLFLCTISKIEKEKITCIITGKEHDLNEPNINVTLIIAPLRNVSRFEFAIEKAVELGVKAIQPVITEHTVSKKSFGQSKMERFNKIIIGAMGQSQRCYLPVIKNTVSFDELLSFTIKNKNKIVMYEFSDNAGKLVMDKSSTDVSLLIGPEGGFSKEEISKLINNDWRVRSLGERKLRAETAAIVSLYDLLNNI